MIQIEKYFKSNNTSTAKIYEKTKKTREDATHVQLFFQYGLKIVFQF